MRQFELSRTTVRQALAELESRASCSSEKGRGTFVAEPAPPSGFLQSSRGFFDARASAAAHGHLAGPAAPRSSRCPIWAATALDLPARDPTASRSSGCARSTDQCHVRRDHVLSEFAEARAGRGPRGVSLYGTARATGVGLGGRRVVQAVTAPTALAELLDVPVGSPLLFVEAVSWNATSGRSSATGPGTVPTARASRSAVMPASGPPW